MNKQIIHDEWFPLVNEEGNITGKATRRECHSGSKLLHPVVHLHLFNDEGALYLQKRSGKKDIQPGKWDTAVGGHVNYNESVMDALCRESQEELNIKNFIPVFLYRYIFESEIEREFVYTFKTIYTEQIRPDSDEVESGRFWSMDEIKANIKSGAFTPNFQYEFTKLCSLLPD